MKRLNSLIIIIVIFHLYPFESNSQNRWMPYINAGYVTNLKQCSDCKKADIGGSVRIGILNTGLFGNGRFGFYTAYLWFNEYHQDYIGYDDKGSALSAGIDFLLLRKRNLRWYVKLGIANEKYVSTYLNNATETERSVIPDFGLMVHIKEFNTYVGWQPSSPAHISIGIGLTIFGSSKFSDINN